MSKTITLFLTTSPYAYQNTLTTVRIAEAALGKGHRVNIFVSSDGVYCFLKGQKAKEPLNAEEEFSRLIKRGLRIFL